MLKNYKVLFMSVLCLACGVNAYSQQTATHVSTFFTDVFDESAAEIVAYDGDHQQLYFTNADENSVTILDFSNPAQLTEVKSIDCDPYGDGINSVSYFNNHIAAAIEGEEVNDSGKIVFFDYQGNFVSQVSVGFLPDMVTFTPNGQKVVVACEGEPSDDYRIDPVGSVAIIDVSGGIANVSQSNVSILGFDGVNTTGDVRVFGQVIRFSEAFEDTDEIANLQVINAAVYPDDTTELFFEDFETTDDSLKNMIVKNEASDVDWYYDDFGGDYFAEMNGFSADVASDDWMIVPAQDLSSYDAAIFSFYNAANFSGGTFEVLVSTDYDGSSSPTSATWDTLTGEATISAGGYSDEFSGDIDVTDYISTATYFAFHYTSTAPGPGGGRVYQIDDIKVEGLSFKKGNSWFNREFRGDRFAQVNGFGADTNSNAWMFTPSMDLSDFDNAYFTFDNTKNFSGGALELLISTDYDGIDPTMATWDTLTGQANWSPGGYDEVKAGTIDISNYLSANTYVAWAYSGGPDPGQSTLWQIDNLRFWGNSLAMDIEPEYIVVSDDNSTAYAFCQENNAVAIIDLSTNSISAVLALGYKDHSQTGNEMDASNRDDAINIVNHPVKGIYHPDAAAFVTINGQGYLITANEGDARDYWFDVDSEAECYNLGGLDYDDGECMAYSEETRVEDVALDTLVFTDYVELQKEENTGRLKITTSMGDTDNDGEFEELYSYGARSYAIWNATTGALVYDSGAELEERMAALEPDMFNTTNDENEFDNRSDDKGPEPEAVTIGRYGDSTYAFIGLERMGGVLIYNITNPTAPYFAGYGNTRDYDESVDIESRDAGDLGPECIVYIDSTNSPDAKNYFVVANEVSGSVSVYEFTRGFGVGKDKAVASNWRVYPNPVNGSVLFSSKTGNYSVVDVAGRTVMQVQNTNRIDMGDVEPGTYLVRNQKGQTQVVIRN